MTPAGVRKVRTAIRRARPVECKASDFRVHLRA
jgi:hypothetical protein